MKKEWRGNDDEKMIAIETAVKDALNECAAWEYYSLVSSLAEFFLRICEFPRESRSHAMQVAEDVVKETVSVSFDRDDLLLALEKVYTILHIKMA